MKTFVWVGQLACFDYFEHVQKYYVVIQFLKVCLAFKKSDNKTPLIPQNLVPLIYYETVFVVDGEISSPRTKSPLQYAK